MKLTTRQGFCLMSAFLLGNVLSGIGGTGHGPKIGYLSVFLSYAIFLIFVFFYQKILKNNEHADFFTLIEIKFEHRGQKAVLLLVAVSAFLSALFSVANYLDFILVSTYFNTSYPICLILTLLLVLYLCLSQEKTMGRYAEVILPLVLTAIIFLYVFGISSWNPRNLTFSFSLLPILKQGGSIFLGPFAEIVFVYFLSHSLEEPQKITKIAVFSGGLVTVIFAGIYLFNLLILGESLLEICRFPTFVSASVVKVGTLIESAESLITVSYSFCDILYSAVCILVCQKAIEHLLPVKKNTKKITAVSAVILVGIFCVFLKSVPLETLYPKVTLALLPLTVGLPLTLAYVTKKKS